MTDFVTDMKDKNPSYVETELNFQLQYLMLKIRTTKNIREVVEKKLHECIALNEYYIVVKPKSTTISLKDTLRVWVQELSQRWMKVKVAKWCWKKWNSLIYIYKKQRLQLFASPHNKFQVPTDRPILGAPRCPQLILTVDTNLWRAALWQEFQFCVPARSKVCWSGFVSSKVLFWSNLLEKIIFLANLTKLTPPISNEHPINYTSLESNGSYLVKPKN